MITVPAFPARPATRRFVLGGAALAVLLMAGCGRDDAAPGGPSFAPATPVFNVQQGQGPGQGPRMAEAVWPQPMQQMQPSQQPPQQSPAGFPRQREREGGFGGGFDNGGASPLDSLMAWERQDMGVRPPDGLHEGEFHGPTPNQIPGGQVITTKGLLPLLQQGMAVHVFDVLGAQQSLPRAIPAAWAAQPGSFDDNTQQQFGRLLQQVTRGQADAPLVFYCGGPQCWMSYNAAARAIRLGYRNVLWYRGGLEAWQRAGQQAVPAQQGPFQGQGATQFGANPGS